MTPGLFTTIAITGFTVAFFHAAIPTHWLPFVLTARVQNWNRSKTLLVTALAGSGHVLFTAVLGFLVTWFGIALSEKIGGWFPWIAGGALVLFGLYYLVKQFRGKSDGHSHLLGGHLHEEHNHNHRGHAHPHGHTHVLQFTEHDHAHDHETIAEEFAHAPPLSRKSDWAAVISLFALLTFSPCEGFIPVYVSGVRFGWGGFFLLTAILSVATIAGMVVFTAITLAGIERLKIGWLEKYESGVVGVLLMLLGQIVILFEH
jgi:ABC-type nickel/cobalt efflux system permease component RcnA